MSFRSCLIAFALLLTGCPTEGSDDDDATEEATPPPGPAYSGGTCPTFEDGLNEGFMSAGIEREFKLLLPDEPHLAPVVFVWHWLNGSADDILEYMEFDQLPEDEGVIVIAPESRPDEQFDWAFLGEASDNPDLQLFEDLLSCVHEQYWVDMDRVYSTGMSAGGLWTSFLTLHESQWLAATAPFSGGATADTYLIPSRRIPVMLTWGGPTDFAVGFNFDQASRYLSEELQGDGSFVVECEHNGGHVPTDTAKDDAWRFFEDHPMGVDPEPWEDGLPDSLPAFCRIP